MTAADLLTVGHADQWFRAILERLPPPGNAPTAPVEVVLFSVEALAQRLDVDVSTVRKWLKKGKTGKRGQHITLQAFYFNTEARIPWPAAVAYGRGEPFDLATLPAPAPPPAATATVPAALRGDEPQMRLAS
ncbi:hypothetical protein Q5H93_14845 [Hymenobacter sp. ASUV-10]|uniref:DNA-binding protein n=1 Tax=Hymenobacter aranciens TaxID=3063996 RepID=A0ABT9BCL9_9BACT|nr:hypothetical protein [Hymenobacter sp. ASUV-10]MDO7876019.1 hypothetical protein [Hymenobacter sp. ASUV-10]